MRVAALSVAIMLVGLCMTVWPEESPTPEQDWSTLFSAFAMMRLGLSDLESYNEQEQSDLMSERQALAQERQDLMSERAAFETEKRLLAELKQSYSEVTTQLSDSIEENTALEADLLEARKKSRKRLLLFVGAAAVGGFLLGWLGG